MPRNATQPAAQPKTQPRATGAKGNNASLSREAIADHLAAFRKRGGRIEILGNTPLRASVAPTSRTKKA